MIGAEDRDVAQPELPPHRGDRGQADQPRPRLSGAEEQQVSRRIFVQKIFDRLQKNISPPGL